MLFGGRVPRTISERGGAGRCLGRWWGRALVFLLLCCLPVAAKALSSADARCRNGIAKGVGKLADAVLKARQNCHKLRMQGLLGSATDGTDPVLSPASQQATTAAAKLADTTIGSCASASSAATLGYVTCPAPCDQVAVINYSSVAICLACLTQRSAGDAVEMTYGTP